VLSEGEILGQHRLLATQILGVLPLSLDRSMPHVSDQSAQFRRSYSKRIWQCSGSFWSGHPVACEPVYHISICLTCLPKFSVHNVSSFFLRG
jgi:hypothetical protein